MLSKIQGKFSGYVYYKKRELFSDNSTQEPIAGCAVYVGDKYLLTDNDGHFEYKFDKGYGFFDVFSLIINYNNRNYSSKISADQEKSYTIDAEEVVSYSQSYFIKRWRCNRLSIAGSTLISRRFLPKSSLREFSDKVVMPSIILRVDVAM